MAEVLVLGGINMDLVVGAPGIPRPGETLLGSSFGRFGGGKGANQALAAARLGCAVELLGQVGTDPFGEELLAGLAAEGVDVTAVGRLSDRPTGVALIVVAKDGQNAIVVAPGANLVWSDAAAETAEARAASCRLLVANLEVPGVVVARACRAARRAGARVVLNPAPYRAEAEGCFAAADVLAPNEIEAAQCAGLPPGAAHDWAAVGATLRSLGPGAVVITLGGEGAVIVEADRATRVPAFRVPVVDTTAAGDAFVGGLAAALLRGRALHEAVRYASACGALAVTRAGAQPSLPHAPAVEALLKSR
jgi:ribokinase